MGVEPSMACYEVKKEEVKNRGIYAECVESDITEVKPA
jgi:hypothetical protein